MILRYSTPLLLNPTNKQASKQAKHVIILFWQLLLANASGSTLGAILEPRWCPCLIQVLSQKLTDGTPGHRRQVGRLPRVDPFDPFCYPPVWARACSLLQHSAHWYGGLGIRLSELEGWKPKEVGCCRWSRCLWNRVLSHIAQERACSWFGVVRSQSAQNLGFWGSFLGRFLGVLCNWRAPKGFWT